jgi:hypothetical protein
MKKTILSTLILSTLAFNLSANENNIQKNEIDKLASSFEVFLEKTLQLPENFDLFSYSVKDNTITYSVKDKLKDEVFSFDVNINKISDSKYTYNGIFFSNETNSNEKLKTIMQKFNNFEYTGDINKIGLNHIVTFDMHNDKLINLKVPSKNSKNEDDTLEIIVDKYNFNLLVDNSNYNSEVDSKITSIIVKDSEHNFTFKNMIFNGNTINNDLSIDLISFDNNSIKNIKNKSYLVKNKEKKQQGLHNDFSIERIDFSNPMTQGQPDNIQNLNFNFDFDFTDKVTVNEIRKSLFSPDINDLTIVGEKIISNPFHFDLDFSFTHKGFNNKFGIDFSAYSIDVAKVKALEEEKNKNMTASDIATDIVANPALEISATLSPMLGAFTMMSPPQIKEYFTSNDDGSVTFYFKTTTFKEFDVYKNKEIK